MDFVRETNYAVTLSSVGSVLYFSSLMQQFSYFQEYRDRIMNALRLREAMRDANSQGDELSYLELKDDSLLTMASDL